MKPEKLFQEFEEHKRTIMNGPRPSPLSINKASHPIQKPSSCSLSLTNISSYAAMEKQHQKPKSKAQHNQPVIIYTHPPKIIHTEARDFMALVQKLTGISQSENRNTRAESHNESSSIGTDEKSSKVSPVSKMSNANPADFPHFAPNSSNFSKYPDGVLFPSPSIMASPSFVEFLKGLPEY